MTFPCAAADALCTGSDWDVLFNSTVLGTFYSDENCSVASGQTNEITMLELLELYEMNETCAGFNSSSYLRGVRCINGTVGYAFYNSSDSTCSLDVVGVELDIFGCVESASGMSTLGAYLETNCTEIAETSDTDDSDDNNDTPAPTTDDTPAPTPGSDDDSSGGVSSFHLAGRIIRYSWSIAAATVTALATALV